ncbi:30S ribosomal protein S18 [Candidatus Vidania fulgoroideae]|uniref:30S ribosomal protein S18 n=1 Tax=Candidatus Vidania fulgoroideorum TaxID=881286 RepID=A0A975ADM6_9PROT|nr:30S ribosomal protein S18 [Candidatus Vidania fulgoroideae]
MIIDFRNLSLLICYVDSGYFIIPRRLTKLRLICYKRLVKHIKLARYLALLPFPGIKGI